MLSADLGQQDSYYHQHQTLLITTHCHDSRLGLSLEAVGTPKDKDLGIPDTRTALRSKPLRAVLS